MSRIVVLLRRAALGLGPLWVGGLALLQVLAVDRWSPVEGARKNLVQYALLGTLFPAVVGALVASGRRRDWAANVARLVQAGLAAWCVGYGLVVVLDRQDGLVPILTAATAALLLVAAIWGRWDEVRRLTRWAPLVVAGLLVLALSWSAAIRLSYWVDFRPGFLTSTYGRGVFVAALVLVAVNVGRRGGGDRPKARLWRVANLAALTLLGLASFRVDTLGAPHEVSRAHGHYIGEFTQHHWGAIVGPAELVRQGGWLLWDTPSQYGFLSTLTLAALPTRTPWQSLYIVHAGLLCLTSAFVFLTLRSIRPGAWNFAFALALSLASVYLLAGGPEISTGPYVHPPLGGYRYFWCLAIVALLARDYARERQGPPGRALLFAGSGVWLVGCLWSFESAVTSTVTWLPAFAILVGCRAMGQEPATVAGRARAATGWLLLPPAMIGAVAVCLVVVYRLRLGLGPDFRAFVDYALAFRGRAGWTLPMRTTHAVQAWLLAFAVLATLAVALARRGGARPLALLVGASAAFWATNSYYATRGADGFATIACPVLCVGVGAGLRLLNRDRVDRRFDVACRAALVPLLTMMITLGFGNPAHLPEWVPTLRRGYVRRVERLLPGMAPSLHGLLRQAQVRPRDPIVFLQPEPPKGANPFVRMNLIPAWPDGGGGPWVSRTWLPTLPFAVLEPLPPERARVYMARYAARHPSGGWLIESRPLARSSVGWFFDELDRTHAPVATVENEHWMLTRYEPAVGLSRRPSAAAIR